MSSIGQVLFAFFEDHLKVQKGLRPGSVRSYRDTLKLFLTYVATSCRRPITRLTLPELSSQRVLDFLGVIESVRLNQVRTRKPAPRCTSHVLPLSRRASPRNAC
jgi:hypothetical protein